MQRLKIVCLAPEDTRICGRSYWMPLSRANFAMMASLSSLMPSTFV